LNFLLLFIFKHLKFTTQAAMMSQPKPIYGRYKMKTLTLILVFVIFIGFPFHIPARYQVKDIPGYQRNIYFEYAEKTANWLKSLAVESSPGIYRWPTAEGVNNYTIGIDSGAAGVGLFFLELYDVTRDVEYLEFAEGAGKYLFNYQYVDGKVDWLNGAAGVGYYFVELWKVTDNMSYLDQAGKIGDWLITQCSEENSDYFWENYINPTKVYTGFAHGTAGIGYFFSRLYDVTHEKKYLGYARGGATWLFSYMWEPGPGQYCWPRLTSDPHANSSWCGGSMGIILFLLQLVDSTGDQSYLEYAKGGTDWLVSQIRSRDLRLDYSFAYCHGAPSIVHILYEMYHRTGNREYLEVAREGAQTLQTEAEKISANIFTWPHTKNHPHDTGLLTGTAGVGNSFMLYYAYDLKESYLQYARGAAHWLISCAEYPSSDFNRAKWINYVEDPDPAYDRKEYETAWYKGASGIGLFFLHLSQHLPPPPERNNPPSLNPIGNKEVKEGQPLEFYLSAQDQDNDSLTFIVNPLPKGAALSDNHFYWQPGYDQAGTYDIYFFVTDAWDADWEQVKVNVLNAKEEKKVKIGKIRR
jgi:rhamnogalacturonyl hydrolase YesR